jgi:hypothetical protein
MPDPSAGETFKGFVGSTARAMLTLAKSHLGLTNETADIYQFLRIPVIRYTVLNAKTAQLTEQFSQLPEVSIINENVQAGLGKLKSIASDPTAKGIKEQAKVNHDLFSVSYQKPSQNVQTELSTVDTLRESTRKLSSDQDAAMQEIIQTIKKAPSPKAASESPQVKEIFATLDKQREKIASGLRSSATSLKNTFNTLKALFKQIFSSIPPTERIGVPSLSDTDQPRNVRE